MLMTLSTMMVMNKLMMMMMMMMMMMIMMTRIQELMIMLLLVMHFTDVEREHTQMHKCRYSKKTRSNFCKERHTSLRAECLI
jgi:hypothetical protein